MNTIETKNSAKEMYETPDFQLIEFNSFEIITTSLNVKENDASGSDRYQW